jgi:hypothetical protein
MGDMVNIIDNGYLPYPIIFDNGYMVNIWKTFHI